MYVLVETGNGFADLHDIVRLCLYHIFLVNILGMEIVVLIALSYVHVYTSTDLFLHVHVCPCHLKKIPHVSSRFQAHPDTANALRRVPLNT